MNSFKKSFLFAVIKTAAFIFMLLPMRVNLWIGRSLGFAGYYLLPKKRKVVYANLKTVFAGQRSVGDIDRLTKSVFVNFIQSVVEILCLPKIQRIGFDKFVQIEGKENITHALARGKGVIFLAMHSGSWELASVVGGVTNGVYHVVANEQPKLPELDVMINEYRTIAGAHVITAGVATKEIVKAMQDNEIVSLVLDQGGKTGMTVPFLGKESSLSTGAIRIAMKYGSAACPVWIERLGNGLHQLTVFPALQLTETGDMEKDLRTNIIKAAQHFDQQLREHPQEYMWFYKTFKYSSQVNILIVDDTRTGHLRQSQAVARNLSEVLSKKDKTAQEHTVTIEWRHQNSASVFSSYVWLAQFLPFLRREDCLRFFLTDASYQSMMKHKADYVVSCGSKAAGINYILSQNHLAKSISILTPGILSKERFDAVVMPEHDGPLTLRRARGIITKVAPNLINAAYLKGQAEGLIKYYSHLKSSTRIKFGVLIGGDTEGVKFNKNQIYDLISQLEAAALHYNAEILLTTSRRTPAAIEQLIINELKDFDRCKLCIIANQRNIPEAVGGILGLSDLVIVSGESISMVSEALSSGKRTIVFSPNGDYNQKPRDKYEDFVLKLNDQGYLMITSVNVLNAKISQLLSRKITLKTIDDPKVIQQGLDAIT